MGSFFSLQTDRHTETDTYTLSNNTCHWARDRPMSLCQLFTAKTRTGQLNAPADPTFKNVTSVCLCESLFDVYSADELLILCLNEPSSLSVSLCLCVSMSVCVSLAHRNSLRRGFVLSKHLGLKTTSHVRTTCQNCGRSTLCNYQSVNGETSSWVVPSQSLLLFTSSSERSHSQRDNLLLSTAYVGF